MKKMIVAVVVMLAVAGFVQAGTEGGMREVQLQGSFELNGNSENDDKDYTVTGQIGYNYFMSPQFSIGGASIVSVTMSDPEDDDEEEQSMELVFLMLRASLYLTGGASQSVVPYVGGQAGAVTFAWQQGEEDDSSTTAVYGAFGGLKIFPTENTSWNVEGSYMMYQPDVEDSDDDDVTYNTTAITIGFSYYF